ncbi:MAG: radical SAM protein [Proteobacteria bacterium]|nr:MAG: radical SAM protein [Pseudomonadota bacterium]
MALLASLERFLLRKIKVDRFLPIQIDITNSCNLRCAHCYHSDHSNKGALDLDSWKQVLRQYQLLTTKLVFKPSIILCGGEPLLSPNLFPLLEHIERLFPEARISILTNGTIIKEKMVGQFKPYKNLQFQVSLDGPNAEIHDTVRGSGNFDRALEGIRLLQNANFKVKALAVLSRRNSSLIEDFFKLAARRQFESMNFVRLVPEGYGRKLVDENTDQPLLGRELKAAMEAIVQMMAKYRVRSHVQAPLFDLIAPGLGRSGRFEESIIVDYQGYLTASSRSKIRLGHALQDGLEKVFCENLIYNSIRKRKVEGCGSCSLYSVCGGDRNAAYAATGNFLAKDPGCWKEPDENPKRRAL